MRIFWLLITSCCFLQDVLSGNILAVLPMPLYSHTMPFIPLIRTLADKGHNVTFISPFPQKTLAANFKNIMLNVTIPKMQELLVANGFTPREITGVLYETFGVWRLCGGMEKVWESEIKKVLPPPSENVDLIILEPYFCQEPLVGLGHIYGAPVVAVMPGPMTPTMAYHSGNPTIPSYVPHIRTQHTDHMSIWARLKNTWITTFELVGHHLYFLKKRDKDMREWLGRPDLPYLGDMLSNISLTMIETHFSINYQRPYTRNVLEVGGISVKLSPPLPADLKKFIDEAEHGVIYFSWGSHFEAASAFKLLQIILASFKHVKQRVLFKMANMNFPDVPENVLIRPWFPQTSILGHKNVVLFITHGGLNSIHEAGYYGVPVVGTPLFTDQPHNVRIMEHLGLGIYLDPISITSPSVMLAAVEKVLNDPSYRERAQSRATIMRDRSLPVLDEAVYWVEYVMRHRGAPHLRPASLDLPWYQLLSMDIFAIVLTIVVTSFSILYCCVRLFIRKPKISNVTKKTQ